MKYSPEPEQVQSRNRYSIRERNEKVFFWGKIFFSRKRIHNALDGQIQSGNTSITTDCRVPSITCQRVQRADY